jgi:hypothetical protein
LRFEEYLLGAQCMDFVITIDDVLLKQVNSAIKSSHARLPADQQMETVPDFGEPEIKSLVMSTLHAFILQDAAEATLILQRQATQKLQESTQEAVSVKVG